MTTWGQGILGQCECPDDVRKECGGERGEVGK